MADSTYLRKPREENPTQSKTRHCLKCRTAFASTWAGERVCPKCKSSSAWREGTDERMAIGA